MKQKMNIKAVVVLLLINSTLFGNEQRMITLYGKIDPRLYAYAVTTYRSMDPNMMRQNYPECTRLDFNTATRKRKLSSTTAEITPDKNSNYKVTIPIDYVGENKCGYEYVGSTITIRRDSKDELYAKIPIAHRSNKAFRISRGTKSGFSYAGDEITEKPHYQLSSGSKIECFTNWYEDNTKRHKSFIAHSNFTCLSKAFDDINGVDTLKTTQIDIDITVDDEKCINATKGTKDHFRDYAPKQSSVERLINRLKTYFR